MIRTITKWVIIGATIGLIVWDVIAYFVGTNETISVQIWQWSAHYPIVPFSAGVLCGHLFWQSKQ